MKTFSGTDFVATIQFPSGPPDGNISWKLRGSDGVELATGTAPAGPTSVSALISIPAVHNILGVGLVSDYRDLTYSYFSSSVSVAEFIRYEVEACLPFGISADGVRRKIGVDFAELKDELIDLPKAYLEIDDALGTGALDAVARTGLTALKVRDAVEAQAALAVLPVLQVRVSKSEDSGTNKFTRQNIDWTQLHLSLSDTIYAGLLAVDPAYDPAEAFTGLFIVAPQATDPFTGA